MISLSVKVLSQLHIIFLMSTNSSKLFDRINQLSWYQDYLADWLQTLNLSPKSHILELGSASGVFTHFLSSKGMQPVGLDLNAKMITLAKTNYPDLNFILNTQTELPFVAGKFDAVIGASLLNVVGDPSSIILQSKQVCKKGGTISFLLPHPDFTISKRNNIINTLQLSGFSAAALSTWQRAAHKIPPNTIVQHFAALGLANPKVTLLFQGALYCVTAIKD